MSYEEELYEQEWWDARHQERMAEADRQYQEEAHYYEEYYYSPEGWINRLYDSLMYGRNKETAMQLQVGRYNWWAGK